MLIVTNDPTEFLERAGLRTTRRGPAARLDLGNNPVNRYPLAPPLPAPEALWPTVRPASPDVLVTEPWPVRKLTSR